MGKRGGSLRQRLRDVASETMLDSAERLMVEKGYERATMQEIAAATGCATGTFYLYFKNKEVLLQAIVARHAKAMFAGARQALAKSDDPLEKLKRSFEAFLGYMSEHRSFFKLFFTALPMRHRALHEKLGGEARQEHGDYNELEREIIREAQQKGYIRQDFPAEVLQEFMEAVTLSLVEKFVFASDPPSVEEQMHVVWGLVTGGLGVERSGHG